MNRDSLITFLATLTRVVRNKGIQFVSHLDPLTERLLEGVFVTGFSTNVSNPPPCFIQLIVHVQQLPALFIDGYAIQRRSTFIIVEDGNTWLVTYDCSVCWYLRNV